MCTPLMVNVVLKVMLIAEMQGDTEQFLSQLLLIACKSILSKFGKSKSRQSLTNRITKGPPHLVGDRDHPGAQHYTRFKLGGFPNVL